MGGNGEERGTTIGWQQQQRGDGDGDGLAATAARRRGTKTAPARRGGRKRLR
ncbi:hypothetical protein Scep_017579 [Stephania cephalantha]|uniref:Uncharacterized protein n=1 Tax=Stephania cephalantha TaxID=152367 RepID=A0AAP0NX29_9MAGN